MRKYHLLLAVESSLTKGPNFITFYYHYLKL